jgi:hypothetical protein
MTNQKKKRGPPPKGSRSAPQRTHPAFVTTDGRTGRQASPEGDDWVYELKFDGYRALIIRHTEASRATHFRVWSPTKLWSWSPPAACRPAVLRRDRTNTNLRRARSST